MTNEARVLKDLRVQHGLSMRKAGELIGLSDSYIAHIETGRMDAPKGAKLDRLLAIYGGIKQKSYYERVRDYRGKVTERDELMELATRANEAQISTILAIAKGIIQTAAPRVSVPKVPKVTGALNPSQLSQT
ncbi:MAG: transcriptional regulator [Bdellovibrionales bacterium]|nr:transcriptional regulator [Bdellovibrionales bacterium]